ncbi:hypothetical protein BD289DRAFT_481367 [Coniella lustricola]|uniref:Uncharacterized protein n=1 Tax=Coniella lustricola TaxID=2025994 RepID=A0A2T3ACG8_9PEZI|nr:hypothetical protein BD289DRAFT_481367 [Coniella lustricola]
MHDWTSLGVAKIIEALECLNAYGATYTYENEYGFFSVRCRTDDQPLIQSTFRKLQNQVFAELRPEENTSSGTTLPRRHHPLVLPSRASKSISNFDSMQSVQQMKLEVPEELSNFPCICAWQDLQASSQSFNTLFISDYDRSLIEKASQVMLVFDAAQKVIFIGASSTDMLQIVKFRLTMLLHDHLNKKSHEVCHTFFSEWGNRCDVELRSIHDAEVQVARSILLDPWEPSNTGYDLSLLRTREASTGREWPSVLGGQKPYYQARIFKGMPPISRLRTPRQPPENQIATWLTGIDEIGAASTTFVTLPANGKALLDIEVSNTAIIHVDQQETMSHCEDNGAIFTGAYDGDDLILLDPDGLTMDQASDPALLDQEDADFNDQSSLQKALEPSARTILVPKPDMLVLSRPVVPFKQEQEPRGELDRFIAIIRNAMRPFRHRFGAISLRLDIGHYFIQNGGCQLGSSSKMQWQGLGLARYQITDNISNDLRGHSYFFTKALTYLGADIDFIRNLKIPGTNSDMWKPIARTTILDFRFMLGPEHGEDASNNGRVSTMVLEVNSKNLSWTIREWENMRGEVYIHCLDQNWDLGARISHDRSRELNLQYQSFAQDLIESLSIDSPEIEFQYAFERAPVANQPVPVAITNVRVRQIARLQHQDEKTFLDITRVLSTKTVVRDEKIWRLSYFANDNLPGRSSTVPGHLSQWYQISVSSVRLEELLKLNESLIPGDEAEWTVEQLENEGVFRDLYHQATDLVSKIDGVGVTCDDGRYQQIQQEVSARQRQGIERSYHF